ncbi:hypothetical protein IAQ61_006908 [Plenodomus lingam]|uniref:uncharacterized protein n=1 Tax=Leptosphaeria maculans TaxID=5022 RepID=UPI00331A3FEA|nr:hypothetical protein IAQ61_006908 [Plenodomus lingam]
MDASARSGLAPSDLAHVPRVVVCSACVWGTALAGVVASRGQGSVSVMDASPLLHHVNVRTPDSGWEAQRSKHKRPLHTQLRQPSSPFTYPRAHRPKSCMNQSGFLGFLREPAEVAS